MLDSRSEHSVPASETIVDVGCNRVLVVVDDVAGTILTAIGAPPESVKLFANDGVL